ncbi:hypothetical protein DFQ30_002664, partial [Apophysomyces sp. BC1015]
ELSDFVDAENKLQAARNVQLQASLRTRRFELWLVVGVSLLSVVCVALMFARHIGSDEIAQLDEVLHDTSRKLVRAEREHALLRADLQRRTGELARVNEELRQQTRDNEMFIYSVSHDLRSPLVNLQGFSRELKVSARELRETIDELDLPASERERLERIVAGEVNESIGFLQSAVTRAAGIIDALLRLSRAGRIEYQWAVVDVNTVLQRIIESLRNERHANGARILIQPLPLAWGDTGTIEQIFGHLVGNALAYLDPSRSGVIEIGWIDPDADDMQRHATVRPAARATGVVQPGLDVRAAHAADVAPHRPGVGERNHVYYVRDNGHGIPAASLSKVFSAFQRLHADAGLGDGIGLALVKRMVERHRGRVWVESADGVGSTFYVALPAHAPMDAQDEPASAVRRYLDLKNQDGGKRLPYWAECDTGTGYRHVLTTHRDDDGHATLVERNLRREGLANGFKRLSDGQQALDYFFDAKQFDDLRNCVVLLDLKMPRVDGIEVLRSCRAVSAPAHANPRSEPSVTCAAHVLVLDDDEGILLLAARALRRAGYRVSAYSTVQRALDCIDDPLPDLLVLDYRLNTPQTGLDFFRGLVARGIKLPAILATGFSDESRIIEALRA